MDPDSRQTGTAETAAPPTVTRKDVNHKWRPFSGKVTSLCWGRVAAEGMPLTVITRIQMTNEPVLRTVKTA
jgi:hypothetical protein